MKKLLLLLLTLSIGLFISSCEDTGTDPDDPEAKASIVISSVPVGAQIWLTSPNSTTPENKGNTPDSVVSLDAGEYTITLRLDGYRDTTWTVDLIAGQVYTRTVTLTTSLVTTPHGPIRLWETTGTTASQPSGLDLSTGQAVSSSNAAADLMYQTNETFTVDHLTATGTKNTQFFISSITDINDDTDSPLYDASWADDVSASETNVFFIHDNEGHYTKMKIVNQSSLTDDPAWIEVEYIYNENANDRRF